MRDSRSLVDGGERSRMKRRLGIILNADLRLSFSLSSSALSLCQWFSTGFEQNSLERRCDTGKRPLPPKIHASLSLCLSLFAVISKLARVKIKLLPSSSSSSSSSRNEGSRWVKLAQSGPASVRVYTCAPRIDCNRQRSA